MCSHVIFIFSLKLERNCWWWWCQSTSLENPIILIHIICLCRCSKQKGHHFFLLVAVHNEAIRRSVRAVWGELSKWMGTRCKKSIRASVIQDSFHKKIALASHVHLLACAWNAISKIVCVSFFVEIVTRFYHKDGGRSENWGGGTLLI